MASKSIWSRMKKVQRIHRFLYAVGLGPLVGKLILLLTTTGRKSGQARVTPLQYEEIEGKIYLGSARGTHADWYRNILADGRVQVRIKNHRITGTAEVVTDPCRIADFLEVRLQRHPRMVGWMMEKIHHVSSHPTRQQLEQIAASEAMVIIIPTEGLQGN
jgi:deazaflavin-dependent oxidoreductase (nitroreductase family)